MRSCEKILFAGSINIGNLRPGHGYWFRSFFARFAHRPGCCHAGGPDKFAVPSSHISKRMAGGFCIMDWSCHGRCRLCKSCRPLPEVCTRHDPHLFESELAEWSLGIHVLSFEILVYSNRQTLPKCQLLNGRHEQEVLVNLNDEE